MNTYRRQTLRKQRQSKIKCEHKKVSKTGKRKYYIYGTSKDVIIKKKLEKRRKNSWYYK
jgi:hypothetical protein